MKLAKILFVLALSTLANAPHCPAQSVPKLVNYQGKLTDAGNNPLPNGTYGVAFRIWSQKAATEPGDQLIWGQDYSVAVANGIFNVILGAPGGTPISGAVTNDIGFAFGAPERHIGITVVRGINGTTISSATEIIPRQQILSSPYALQAELAARAHELTGVITTEQLADGSITSQKIADGAVSTAKIASESVTEAKLANLAVSTEKLKDGSVTTSKLAPRVVAPVAPLGGIAKSPALNRSWPAIRREGWSEEIAELQVTLTTSGGPILITLLGYNGGNMTAAWNSSYSSGFVTFTVLKGNNSVLSWNAGSGSGTRNASTTHVGPVIIPYAAGSHTFRCRVDTLGLEWGPNVENMALMVLEL